MYIEELIDAIRRRPGMYIKEEKIEYIYYFISGKCFACSLFVNDDMDKMFCDWFGEWLLKWIEENVNALYEPKSRHWYHDIKAIAECEEQEVPLFYKLCALFFDDYRDGRGYFKNLPLENEE